MLREGAPGLPWTGLIISDETQIPCRGLVICVGLTLEVGIKAGFSNSDGVSMFRLRGLQIEVEFSVGRVGYRCEGKALREIVSNLCSVYFDSGYFALFSGVVQVKQEATMVLAATGG